MTTTQQAKTRPTAPTNEYAPSGASLGGSGVLVSTLLAGLGFPTRTAVQRGIVVTGASGSGNWQYSFDANAWVDFGEVSPDSTLLFDAACRIRFVPAVGERAADAPRLDFDAWPREPGRLRLVDSAA